MSGIGILARVVLARLVVVLWICLGGRIRANSLVGYRFGLGLDLTPLVQWGWLD